MKTIYVSTGTIRDAQERAGRLYMILRDCTPVIADLNMHNMQVITETRKLRMWHRQRTQSDCRPKEIHTKPCMNSYSID